MSGFADPKEGLAFADIYHAVAPLATFVPTLVRHNLARETHRVVALKQVLDANR